MYKVKVDENLVYQPLIKELSLASAVVTQEENCAGTFVYKMYPNNTYYGQEKKMKSIVKVYNNTNLIFKGRVLNSTKGFYKSKIVTCEGALSFLLDSVQRPYEFSGTPEELFEQFLDSHNEQMTNDPEKQFVKGIVTVTDPNDYIARSDTTYLTTRESMTKKLVDLCGGYIRVRYDADEVAYLDYLEDFTTINSQTVEFGKNLLDLEEIVKGEDIATCIIPLGATVETEDTEQKLTIADVNDGVDYVYDEDAVETYGHIFKVVEHDDVTLASNLLTKGYEDLQDWVNLIVSISLSAVDLSAIDKSVDAFEVGSYTRITSAPHDFDDIFLTRKRTINILDPSDSTLELGEERTTLTDKTVEADKNLGEIVETVETITSNIKINEKLISQSVTSTVVQYAQGASATEAPEDGWSTTPTWSSDTYTWQRVVTTYASGTVVIGEPVNIQGASGEDGTDAIQYYTWVKYADTPTSGMSDDPTNKDYLGIAVNKLTDTESTNYSDYTWQYTKGIAGLDGIDGTNGIAGTNGTNGLTSYFHIKYSVNSNGSPMTETPSTYIGTYVDFTEADSTNYLDYTWQKLEGSDGADGTQGIAGTNGDDGLTSYLHIAYANSADGVTDFSVSVSSGKSYIGQYTDFNINDSTTPSSYSWTLIKGEDGIAGVSGEDGITYYTWVKYADDASGTNMSDSPTDKDYIGLAYNKDTATESTTASDYTWSLFKGEDGVSGTTIVSIEAQYYLSTSKTTQTGGSWVSTSPTWAVDTYMWTRTKITYENPDSVEYTEPICDSSWEAVNELDKIINSDTAPSDITALWCDTSVTPNVLKKWNADTEDWESLDQSEAIALLREDLSSSIEQTVESITQIISEECYTKDEADALISAVSTAFEQTISGFEFSFETYEANLESLANSTAAEFANISKYIRFEDGNIVLGESGSEMTLVQENDRISFRRNGVEVMYITGNMIYITDGKYVNSLGIGDYEFKVESNGSVSFGEV